MRVDFPFVSILKGDLSNNDVDVVLVLGGGDLWFNDQLNNNLPDG